MNARRLAIYVALLIVLALSGVALTYWALFVCAPPPLPGDELWTMRQNLGEAVGLVLRLGTKACFTGDTMGGFGLWLGTRTTGVLLVLLAGIVLWELVGRRLRRSFFRMNGGHVVLAGHYDDLRELAHSRRSFAGTFFLAPDRMAANDLARHRPFAEIVPIVSRKLQRQLEALGVGKARLLAAATRNDLTNVAIAEAGLATRSEGELLVRLEEETNKFKRELLSQTESREACESEIYELMKNVVIKIKEEIEVERSTREGNQEQLLNLLEDTCQKIEVMANQA